MTATPKGYHDAEAWLQVSGKVRDKWDTPSGTYKQGVDSIKVEAMTQSRPNPPRKGCIAVKVTLRIPDGAFLPFSPEAVITVPENMVVRGPIEADVVGDEGTHEFVPMDDGGPECAFVFEGEDCPYSRDLHPIRHA